MYKICNIPPKQAKEMAVRNVEFIIAMTVELLNSLTNLNESIALNPTENPDIKSTIASDNSASICLVFILIFVYYFTINSIGFR